MGGGGQRRGRRRIIETWEDEATYCVHCVGLARAVFASKKAYSVTIKMLNDKSDVPIIANWQNRKSII